MRARHQQGSRDHQVDRAGDRRSRVRRRLDRAGAAAHAHVEEGRRHRLGAGRTRGRRATQSRRATASRCSRSPIASAGCCATASPSSSWRSASSIGGSTLLSAEGVVFRTRVNVGVDVSARDLAARLRCGAAGRRRRPAARSRGARPRARGHPFRDGVPRRSRTAAARATSARERIDLRSGQARDHHRRRRHRRRLSGHRASSGRGVGRAARIASRRRRHARAEDNPWPLWPNIFRTSSAHEEGGDRLYAVATTELRRRRAGHVRALRGHRVTRVVTDGRVSFEPVPDTRSTCAPTSCCWRWDSSGRKEPPARRSRRALQRARHGLARRAVDDERAWRVRRRRHAARTIVDRLGD